MTSSSAHQTDGMLRQRRTQSETKHRAVRTAIDACVARGTTDSAAGIARKAAVTETFLYRHESEPCALCAQMFGMGPVGYLRTQMARILDSRDAHAQEQGLVTAATTRADLANSRAANHRLQQRLQALERRLGEVLGHAVQDSLAERGRLAQDIDPASEKRIRELSEQTAALQSLLNERDEELDAVRRLNTDLTRRLNATAMGKAP
jgi:hypothetical protein